MLVLNGKQLSQHREHLFTFLCRVLQSLKLGKRLPESQFTTLKVAAKGQQSVYGMFKKTTTVESSGSET
jgi:hypothetical protein